MLSFVLRTSKPFQSVLVLQYDSLLQSILEYYSSDRVNFLRVEKVQKRFIRYTHMIVYGRNTSVYLLGVPPLSIVYLEKHFYKILVGLVNNLQFLAELSMNVPCQLLIIKNRSLFFCLVTRTNLMILSPVARGIKLLNQISVCLILNILIWFEGFACHLAKL